MAERAGLGRAGNWVEAAPFRAQLRHLMGGTGLSAAEVATVAGISPQLAEHLLTGRNGRPVRRVSRETARRLLALSIRQLRQLQRRTEPAGRARWELARLRAAGWDHPAIADRVGATAQELDELRDGAAACRRLLAVRLVAAARDEVGPPWYPAAWGERSPSRAA
jgi:transcriptional regulator with XRE-family HTH domain